MNAVLELIKKDEGLRLKAYDDATGKTVKPGYLMKGHVTIGYGINVEAGITEDEAIYLLHQRVFKIHTQLDSAFGWYHGEGIITARMGVLISMVYNMGIPRFRKFKKMLKALENYDHVEATKQLLDSKAARNPLLKRRYKHLAKMLETNEWHKS